MDRCANSEALAVYEDDVSKEELKIDRMKQELVDAIQDKYDDILIAFRQITESYDSPMYYTLEDFIKEEL